jgi:hypothetical protein
VFAVINFIMKKKLLFSIITITLLLFSNISFSQTVNLGILESFEGYTGAGAITNAAGATWTGDAGTNIGIISGFGPPPSFTGNTYNANAVTAQCRFDLFRLYIHLNDLFVDYPATHAAAFGGGETITPGVYSIPGAGSIGSSLTLDGGGNPDAFFVIKFYGAMTVGANAVVNLIGGTQSCNVFFIAQGAISVAADANIKGTLFSKIGAVGLGANTVLEGRMLSLQGAIVNGAGAKAGPPPGTCTIPIFCESNCSAAPAVDVLGVLSNYALYTNLGAVPNTSTSGIDGNIGTNGGIVSGFGDSVVIGSTHTTDASTIQANIDLDTAYNSLMALPNTVPSDAGVSPVVILAHAASFGSVAAGGEKINAGVYFIDGAGSLLGTLVLDGQNNPDAIFVFKFAGALTVAAQAKMILINGARRCNVFWIGGAGVATGAISIGAGATLKGTFLSHGGACGSGADVFLAGRQLSTGGAVNTYSGIIYNNPVCVTSTSLNPPIKTTVIVAVTENTAAIKGSTGGSTPALTNNDTLNGLAVTIGTAPGNVKMTIVAIPAGITVDTATGIVTVAPNTAAANYLITYTICEVSNPANCSTTTSKVSVIASLIDAVTETTAAINGITGGSTPALTANDTLNGLAVNIGTASGNVKMTTGTLPTGITVDTATGIVTVAPNTPAASYPISYTICEVNNPTNCDTVISTIVVLAPIIDANYDTGGPINGATGGTNAVNVLTNDTVNGSAVNLNQINLTTITPNGNLTLNADGSIDVAPNTPSGTYTLIYQICEKLNPTNCNQAEVSIEVLKELPDFTITIDIDALVFISAGDKKDFVVNISEIKGASSEGQVVVKMVKQSAFLITYGANNSTSNVNNGVSVNNNDWDITETATFITMKLKTGIVIGVNTFSAIGFTIERKSGVPTQTSQPITVTIVSSSGLDSQNYNNTYNTVVKAQ